MPERMTNSRRVTASLSIALSPTDVTLTPASYTNFPPSGQGYLVVGTPRVSSSHLPDNLEIVHVTNWAARPWPIVRGQSGTTAVVHEAGEAVSTSLTEEGLAGLVGVYNSTGTLIANATEIKVTGNATVSQVNGQAVIDVTAGAGASGHTIREETTVLPARTNMSYKGTLITATDNAGADSTDVTVRVPSHTELTDIGANTHAQLDTHLAASAPHAGHLTSSHTADVNAHHTESHQARHAAGAADAIAGDLDANARVGVRVNSGGTTYKRRRQNLKAGAGIAITAVDDSTDEEVEVTIASSGGVGNGIGWSLTHSAAQSLPNNTPTVLSWNTENADTHSFHDTGTNPDRVTIPSGVSGPIDGVASLSFATANGGVRRIEVLRTRSAVTTVVGYAQLASAGSANPTVLDCPYSDVCEVGDYYQVRAYQNASGGAAVNVEASSAYSPKFWGYLQGASSSAGGSGHTIQADGVAMSPRANLNFVPPFTVADDAANDQTDIGLDGSAYEAAGTAAATVATHEAAGNPHPTYATDADLTAHAAAADPHTGYVLDADLTTHTGNQNAHHGKTHNLFSTDHPDVDAADVPANGDVLTYNSAAGKWQAAPAAGGGSGIAVEEADGVPALTGITKVVFDNGTVTNPSAGVARVTNSGGGGGSGLYSAYVNIRDEKAQNTTGGTFTNGAWRTRDLNTEHADTGNHATLATNQITLAAGTWRVLISTPAYYVDQHQARLQNITDATTVLLGTSEYTLAVSNGAQTRSIIAGRFTLAAAKTLEVQHRCLTSKATNGLGVQCNFGTEIFTVFEAWKEA